MHDQFQFRVRPGVAQVRFGDPGWRLGYTKDAVSSHFVFRQLQKKGVIPQGVRFQVCLPLTFSAIGLFFPDPADHAKVAAGVTAAFRAEIAKIVELIPPQELAIDLAVENRLVDTALARGGGSGRGAGRAAGRAGGRYRGGHPARGRARVSRLLRHAERLAIAPTPRSRRHRHAAERGDCGLRSEPTMA